MADTQGYGGAESSDRPEDTAEGIRRGDSALGDDRYVDSSRNFFLLNFISIILFPFFLLFEFHILHPFSFHNVYLPAEFKKDLKEKRDQLKALDDMYIEISPKDYQAANSEELGGICGSFRKLEVD